jgi:hypothetical protein
MPITVYRVAAVPIEKEYALTISDQLQHIGTHTNRRWLANIGVRQQKRCYLVFVCVLVEVSGHVVVAPDWNWNSGTLV